MSQENVELVRGVNEGWARGDFSQIDAFHPEIEFEMVDWPHQTKVRGIEAMWRTWRSTLGAWDDFRAIPTEYVDCGGHVLVLNHIEGSGKESGAEVSADTATVWTVEDGLVTRLALYWDVARARQAAERGPWPSS
jgi:ketosteroid isomerase-like protein